MKFRFRAEQLLPAADALIGPWNLGVLILAGEGRLSSLLPGYMKLIRRKLFLPSSWIFADFLFHRDLRSLLLFQTGLTVSDSAHALDDSYGSANSRFMKNSISNLVTDKPSKEKAEKRTTRRARMSRPLRVRPSDHRDD